MKKKLIRITTVPSALGVLLKGQLKYMSGHYEVIGVSSSGNNGHLNRVASKEKIRVIPIEMTRKITPFKDLLAAWKLYRVFKKEKPFIVHSHTPKAGTLGMLAGYFAGVPHRLHTIAGLPLLEATGAKRWLLNQVEKITYLCATRVYPNSHELRKIAIKNNFAPPSKLFVIGNGSSNGINTSHFDPTLFNKEQKNELRNSLDIQKDDFVFIFVGRMVKDKGVNELIEAFEKIAEKNNKVKLLILGDYEKTLDPLKEETRICIESNPQILAVGWIEDVRPYFSISNIMVFPSYREGFPNVVMQAGAMGLHCIATDINGCNEIIVNGKNGVLIPPKDAEELRKQMELAIGNSKEHRNDILCRQMIVDRYDQMFIWNSLLKEYQQLEAGIR